MWTKHLSLLSCAIFFAGCEREAPLASQQFLLGAVQVVIGESETAAPEYIFGAVRSVASDEEGRIYVADASSSEVRVFAPDGLHIQTIGREGQGPGEFQVPLDVLISDDGLWVRDLSRVTHFAPRSAGAVPDSVVAIRPLPGRATAAFRRGQVVNGVYYSPSYFYPLEGGTPSFFYEGLESLTEIDTVAVPPLENADRIRGTSYRGGSIDATQRRIITALARAPFEAVPAWDLSAAGNVLAGPGAGAPLREFDSSGAVVREYVVPFASRRVSESALNDSAIALRARLDSLTVPLADIEGVSQHIRSGSLPEVLPDYLGVYVAGDHRVWVQVWPEPDGTSRSDFVVFDSTGQFTALVSVPVSFSANVPPHFQGGRIVGVVADELTGVQRVVVAGVALPP